jgi:lanthanide-dependent methanol dehydrogenase
VYGPRAALAIAATFALISAATAGAQRLTTDPPGGSSTAATADSAPAGTAAGDWVLPGRTYGGTRFSELTTIDTANASKLKEVWSYNDGILDGHEGQPLVVHNTMYMVTPYPNKLIAFDLTKPGPAVKWTYAAPIDPQSFGKACCDDVNRGASYADGKIIYNLLDNHTVAVDAETGKEVWRTKLGEAAKGETMTMAPLVANGKVFVGNSGGELGVWGWITALDVKTGHIVWQAHNTGSDHDVKIGAGFKPFYAFLQGKDLGLSTWRGQQWKIGGATVWGWVTYDPATNTIFYGTSNPGAWNPDLRPGDNLWATTLFARDASTGDARWAFDFTPHDEWDYDGVNENVVADITVNGQPRKVVVNFGRDGFGYTVDRTTGEVLVAQPFKPINWATGFDFKSGRPIEDSTKNTHQGHLTTDICPSSTGAKDQEPSAFSPQTGYFYLPSTNLCMDYGGVEAKYIAGTPYVGAAVKMYAGPGGNGSRGEFLAWDPATGKKVWGINEKFPVRAGALATAGGVVFYGTLDGDFKAVNAKTGAVLWSTHFKSGIVGNPITYLGPDNKQYIAIYEGVGGWMGAIVPGNLSPDDPWAALGAVGAVPDLIQATKPGGGIHVFAIPQ